MLDFSDLGAKGVGYARHQSPLKEVNEMRTLPIQMIRLLAPFVPLFSKRVWQNAQVLPMGAFPQHRAGERSAPRCARWAWTNTNASIATTGC
jgi:type II secretory pathway component PulK